MIVLGKSEAAITMLLDILVSNQNYPVVTVVNNLAIKSDKPYKNPLIEVKEVQDVESVIAESNYVLGAMMPETKIKLYQLYNFDKNRFENQYHKSATLSVTAKVGQGILIDAQANISAHVSLGNFVTVYAGTTISHHSTIGDYCTICPNASIAGNVEVGIGTFIGIGTTIMNGVKIGSNCTIGAGAVVVRDVKDNSIIKGNPAK
jgi:sugar O-acyltransferase (sialic acid O-acetyltransferase NeuD family)